MSKDHLDLVKELKTNLFDYLEEVGARFPVKDPLYSSELEEEYLKYISTKRIQRLEKQRLEYLSPDFDPKNNWWGSDLTKD